MPKKATKVSSLADVLKKHGVQGSAKKEMLSTGSVIWDKLLGGGLARGSMIEVGGPPGIGKTTLVLASLRHLCSQGHKCAYMDFEGGVNESQLKGIGLLPYVENGSFVLLQENMDTFRNLEECLDACLADEFTCIVIDSDTAVVPSSLFEEGKSIEDMRPGQHAQLVALLLNKYKGKVRNANSILILISQVRVKFNFLGMSQTVVSGGNAKQHFAHIRFQMKEESKLKKKLNVLGKMEDVQIGSDVTLWATKNRYAPPFVKAPVRIIFGRGFHNGASLYVWLKSHEDKDGRQYLEVSSNGRSVLHWHGIDIKFASAQEVDEWINEHVPEILQIIEEHGGFEIIEGLNQEENENDADTNYGDASSAEDEEEENEEEVPWE